VNPHRPGPKSFKCSERIFRLLVPSVPSRQFFEHRSVLARLLLEDMFIDHHIHLAESDRNGTFGILVETEYGGKADHASEDDQHDVEIIAWTLRRPTPPR